MTETDLCAILWKSLVEQGFDPNAEVPVVIDGQTYRPDIVHAATAGSGWIWAWQAKLKLGPFVVSQAIQIRPYAEFVAVAVKETLSKSPAHRRHRHTLSGHGIGLLYVSEKGRIDQVLKPIHQIRQDDRILEGLTEAQKRDTPGRPGGKVIRPDKWDGVRDLLKEFPKLMLWEIASQLEWPKKTRLEFHRLTTRGEIRGISWKGSPAEFECDE